MFEAMFGFMQNFWFLDVAENGGSIRWTYYSHIQLELDS